MSTMTRFDQLGALFSEDCATPTRMANRGFTIAGAPTVWVSARGKTLTYFDGSDDKATWVGRIGTVKSISFWFICKSNNEQFFDFDGGTHTIDSAVGVIRANGWTSPTIYVDGVATGNYSLNVLHHCCITSATGFDASSFKIGTDNTSYGAVAVADVVLFGTVVTAAEALLLATDKLFRYDESLVSDWDFSTINPRDRKGNNNLTGSGIVAATDIVPGPYGTQATEYNGSDESSIASSYSALALTSAISISSLVKLASLPVLARIVNKRTGNDGYFLTVDSGTPRLYVFTDSFSNASAAAVIVPDRWYHIVGVYDGSNITVTVDGVRGTPTAKTGAIAYPNNTYFTVAGPSYLPGCVANVSVYSLGLSLLQCNDLGSRIRQGR